MTAAPATATAVLITHELTVGYRRRRHRQVVLDSLGLRLEAGAFVCLLGANGSGKSTLLRTLAGMQPPLGGTVALCGDDAGSLPVLERARRIAVVLTDQPDPGVMRARDLVGLGRYPHTGWDGRLSRRDHAVVGWAMRATGAAGLAERNVAELSDGERQRVMIARALAQQPALLALDEPVAYVDGPRRLELVAVLRRLARDAGVAVLITTHDVDLALRSADELWLVADGRIVTGAPEDLALGGWMARAFPSDDFTFDLDTASFVASRTPPASVHVRGEGAAIQWAARALQREGLALTDDASATFTLGADRSRWMLNWAGGHGDYASIAELVAAVRGLQRGPQTRGRSHDRLQA